MEESQLTVLTPALSRCSRISNVNLYDNDLSMPILKDLLLHTANWSKMNEEQYSDPVECYDDFGYIETVRFLHRCPELMDALSTHRHLKRIFIARMSAISAVLCL
ncbi:PRAME family member 17 [Cricetulus griseus]|nr:PRAME family member 17 [Cricetulus griseus]